MMVGKSGRMRSGVWFSCLLSAVVVAGGVPETRRADSWLSTIGWDLHSKMSEVLDMVTTNLNFSEPVINATYIASVEFDMRAMGPVYNNTHRVIDTIAEKQAYPEGMLEVSDGHVEVTMTLRKDWKPLLGHYAGPISVVVVAALMGAALPLAGVFWCCCHWWRTKRRRPFDRKYDACLKALLAILLIGLLTLFLFGVVVAFATDSQVESGLAEAPGAVRAGVRDARTYLNATQSRARWLLVNNYRELERKMAALLTSSGLTISLQLGEFSRAVSVTTLASMVDALDGVQADLRNVQTYTQNLRTSAEQLNAVLRSVKAQLLITLARCDQPACVRLQEKHKIGQLDTEIHYNQMPDVSELLDNVTALLESNIKQDVAAGQKVFRDIQREIQRSIDEHLPQVQLALTQIGEKLENIANEITWRAGNASHELKQLNVVADNMQQIYEQYGPYRRYTGRGAAAALLLIVVVAAWGLVCGVCGKRPDVYGASDCCNKGAGSRSLLCGMCLMFVIGGLCSLVLVVYFTVGVSAQRFLCDPLTEPRDNRLFGDVERFVDLEKLLYNEQSDEPLNLTQVLISCHGNHSIYKVLQLHRLYNMSMTRARADSELSARVAALSARYSPPPRARPVTILSGAARDKLTRLGDTGLSDFDFDRILHALETNVTSLALDSLASQLEQTAGALEARGVAWAEVAGSLRNAGGRLHMAQQGIVATLLGNATELDRTAKRLRDSLRFNHSSLKEAIAYLMHETSQAETFLNTQGQELVRNMTKRYATTIARLLDLYLDRLVRLTEEDVGRCGPLSHAYNATRDAHCHKILMPTNGYWMALSWCVVLLVPLLVVSQRLARLYLHLDPYPGPLVEAEYLYDAYADRDNVPLANAYKAEKRSGREVRSGGSGGGSGGGGSARGGAGGSGAGAAGGARAVVALPGPVAGDAHHARRYNDMAPKHWEEGPPRYHGPTEYERPPPYYYPGPIDRQ